MKMFKHVSIYIFIILLLFIIGLSLPEVNYSNKIDVNKLAEQAWEVFADESKLAEWNSGFKIIKNINGEENIPDSKYEIIINKGAVNIKLTEEVITCKGNELYTYKFCSEDVTGNSDNIFSPTQSGKSNTAINTLKGEGYLSNSFMPILNLEYNTKDKTITYS